MVGACADEAKMNFKLKLDQDRKLSYTFPKNTIPLIRTYSGGLCSNSFCLFSHFISFTRSGFQYQFFVRFSVFCCWLLTLCLSLSLSHPFSWNLASKTTETVFQQQQLHMCALNDFNINIKCFFETLCWFWHSNPRMKQHCSARWIFHTMCGYMCMCAECEQI